MRTLLSIAPGLDRGSRTLFGAAAAAVLAVTMLVGGASSAQSDSGSTAVDAECMQRCFDEYIAALNLCESTCSECALWLGPICLVRVVNQQCFNACAAQAKARLRICQAACNTAS